MKQIYWKHTQMPKKILKIHKKEESVSILIGRIPYSKDYDLNAIDLMASKVDNKGLICLSIPIHVEAPTNFIKLIAHLESKYNVVSLISWHRDRHIVTTKSKRLTNAWEPLLILSKSPSWHLDRDTPSKPKKGAAGREEQFDEDEFLTCIGDHWPVRFDRRDRRLLPAQIVLNLIQLGGISSGDTVLDPWGNPSIKEQCEAFGMTYCDGGLESPIRKEFKKSKKEEENDI